LLNLPFNGLCMTLWALFSHNSQPSWAQ